MWKRPLDVCLKNLHSNEHRWIIKSLFGCVCHENKIKDQILSQTLSQSDRNIEQLTQADEIKVLS